MGHVFVLSGAQTDFAVTWSRGGHGAFEMMNAAIDDALEPRRSKPRRSVSRTSGHRPRVPGARVAQTLNIGGSCTTTVSFAVGAS